jgi:hypothetical protein
MSFQLFALRRGFQPLRILLSDDPFARFGFNFFPCVAGYGAALLCHLFVFIKKYPVSSPLRSRW